MHPRTHALTAMTVTRAARPALLFQCCRSSKQAARVDDRVLPTPNPAPAGPSSRPPPPPLEEEEEEEEERLVKMAWNSSMKRTQGADSLARRKAAVKAASPAPT